MARRPYVASGKSGPAGVPLMAAVALGGALAVGVLEGLLSGFINLLVIFPALVGGAAGGGAAWAIGSRKVRKPMTAVAVAALAACVGYGATHYVAYRSARSEISERVATEPSLAEVVQQNGVDATVDAVLTSRGAVLPFIGFLDLAAENGITISKAGSSSSSKPTVTGMGVWILWSLEMLIAVICAVFIAYGRAAAPFCEGCDTWYDRTETLAVGAAGEKLKETKGRFEAGQLAEALRDLGQSDGKSATVVLLQGCGSCNAHEPLAQLKVIAALNTNKPQEKIVFSSLVTPTEAAAMRAAAPQPTA